MTSEQTEEFIKCRADFQYFCANHVFIQDKATHKPVRFELWNAQKGLAAKMVAKVWLMILKARRLGITWLCVAYAVWLITFFQQRTIVILNQDKEYANDFLDKCRFIISKLPDYMQQRKTADSKSRLEFNANKHGGSIRSVACTKRAIHSLDADVVIFDEASKQRFFAIARLAAEPAVETGKGHIIVLSTSDGPQGDFYELWKESAATKTKYDPVFLRWSEHPSRSEDWHEKESALHLNEPLYMRQQYPNTAEEAFESAAGRVFPSFVEYGEDGKKFIKHLDIHPDWKKYRALDWGGVDPFVCLFGAVIPGDGPSLTIDPSCKNLIREMLAYCYSETGEPEGDEVHAIDSLRYMIVTPGTDGIVGHLHIYKEIYIPNSASKHLSVPELIDFVVKMSKDQKFALTVADRSRPDNILLCHKKYIRPIVGQRCLNSGHSAEIEQGLARVNALIIGTVKDDAASFPKTRYPQMANLQRKGIF